MGGGRYWKEREEEKLKGGEREKQREGERKERVVKIGGEEIGGGRY